MFLVTKLDTLFLFMVDLYLKFGRAFKNFSSGRGSNLPRSYSVKFEFLLKNTKNFLAYKPLIWASSGLLLYKTNFVLRCWNLHFLHKLLDTLEPYHIASYNLSKEIVHVGSYRKMSWCSHSFGLTSFLNWPTPIYLLFVFFIKIIITRLKSF